MAERSNIEWTDATWNPVHGCTRVSEGCRNCYAERMVARFPDKFGGTSRMTPQGPRWTGQVVLRPEVLEQPLRWRKPRRVFVNSMSDLFHPDVPYKYINRVFGVMAEAKQHVFQILTKRPERMAEWFRTVRRWEYGDGTVLHLGRDDEIVGYREWPLPNVWLGVSVEDQEAADRRIPYLLHTPAAVRFVSCEPLLGPVDLTNIDGGVVSPEYRGIKIDALIGGRKTQSPWHLNWVIVGGESGPGARPMHPDWVRSIRDQATAAGVPFFFKQWGEWVGVDYERWVGDFGMWRAATGGAVECKDQPMSFDNRHGAVKVGKAKAGALLDGREWREFPEVGGIHGA